MNLEFHHLGLAVRNMEHSLQDFRLLFPNLQVSEIYTVSSQQVRVCFVELPGHPRLELIEPTGPDAAVSKLVAKGITFYHTAYQCESMDQTLADLTSNNYKCLMPFASEAFGGKTCCFAFSPSGILIELISR